MKTRDRVRALCAMSSLFAVAVSGACTGRTTVSHTVRERPDAEASPRLALATAPHLSRATGTTRGDYELDAHGAPCAGFASRAPSFEVEVPEDAGAWSIVVTTETNIDTTLMIEDSLGRRFCNDDTESASLSPHVRDTFAPGLLRVWVGTFRRRDVGVSFVLRISTLEDLLGALGDDAPPELASARGPGVRTTQTSSESPADHIREQVNVGLGAVRECYARFLAEHGRPGRVVVKFIIETDGTVQAAATSTSTLGHIATERCIASVARTFRFELPNRGDVDVVVVRYPFMLEPPAPSASTEP